MQINKFNNQFLKFKDHRNKKYLLKNYNKIQKILNKNELSVNGMQ